MVHEPAPGERPLLPSLPRRRASCRAHRTLTRRHPEPRVKGSLFPVTGSLTAVQGKKVTCKGALPSTPVTPQADKRGGSEPRGRNERGRRPWILTQNEPQTQMKKETWRTLGSGRPPKTFPETLQQTRARPLRGKVCPPPYSNRVRGSRPAPSRVVGVPGTRPGAHGPGAHRRRSHRCTVKQGRRDTRCPVAEEEREGLPRGRLRRHRPVGTAPPARGRPCRVLRTVGPESARVRVTTTPGAARPSADPP